MWNHVVVEGYCFAEEGKYPCGQIYPTGFCLGVRANACPYFDFSESSEREASRFVPLRLILWDRLKSMVEWIGEKLQPISWGFQFHYSREDLELLERISIPEDYAYRDRTNEEFNVWIKEQHELSEV